MTAYADFEFYRDIFLGEKIPEDKFSHYALRASERIDELTFNRLKPIVSQMSDNCPTESY